MGGKKGFHSIVFIHLFPLLFPIVLRPHYLVTITIENPPIHK